MRIEECDSKVYRCFSWVHMLGSSAVLMTTVVGKLGACICPMDSTFQLKPLESGDPRRVHLDSKLFLRWPNYR